MSSLRGVNESVQDADGENTGYLVGTVVENDDPLGLGRVKVEIPGLMEPDIGEVPWVGPHKNSPFGQGPNYGCYGSPQIGAKVKVRLQNGDGSYGLVEADLFAPASVIDKFKDPKVWGFRDPAGNELYVNLTTGAWEWTHGGGSTVKWGSSGLAISIKGGNADINVEGDANIKATGNVNVEATGEANISGTVVNLN